MQLQPRPLEPATLDLLRHMLADEQKFLKLLAEFIDKAVEDRAPGGANFKRIYKNSMVAIAHENAREIATATQSPIERTFIRSLSLNFLRGDGLGLLVHPTVEDTPEEISRFRATLARFRDVKTRFDQSRQTSDFSQFLDDEARWGRITWNERRSLTPLIAKYFYAPLDAQYHVTLQARFPGIHINGQPVTADLYFWVPTHPEINIIVECDGFEFHSSKEKFKSDRQRDRAFKAQGYDVMRFSGSEIYGDPVFTAHELATYLDQRARDATATVIA